MLISLESYLKNKGIEFELKRLYFDDCVEYSFVHNGICVNVRQLTDGIEMDCQRIEGPWPSDVVYLYPHSQTHLINTLDKFLNY